MPPARIPEPKVAFAPFAYVCRRAAGPINVDGRLDEAAWTNADWTEVFGDIEGASKPAPRFRTRAQMLWDDRYFYIGAYLEEPHVWATLKDRDSIIFQDNDFEVFIDPDGDTHNYYELEMNALNTVWDLLLVRPYRDGGPAVHSWDIQGLMTGVHVMGTLNDPSDRDKAWTVEIALPFAVLKECIPGKPERPEDGDQWRVNFSRVEYQLDVVKGAYVKAKNAGTGRPLPEDNWTWTPQGVVNIHYPEMWGHVQFSTKTPGKGKEKFVRRPEEKVKWALRKVYYAEWAHYYEKSGFGADVGALALKDENALRIKGWSHPPTIQITPSLFEAVYAAKSGETWHIRQDGLIWKETPPEPAAK
ncbi:MAG: carbohydrate-binding family 9-like protein [Candidatus Aminicenantes bacterium RBG_19FT_COMBO_65_30]|nr:MAG: carbohydrate-binding family 9-like protein [Candidatus Aminicenantes bacterium RBG_19FT_COMBO_65_30]